MKQLNKLLLTLLLSGAGTAGAFAEYVYGFETPIDVSSKEFTMPDGWGHIVDPSYNSTMTNYMSYSYKATGGVDGTGALHAEVQDDGTNPINDLIITPPVKGDVTIMALDTRLDYDFDPTFIEVYAYDADSETMGAKLLTIEEADIRKDAFKKFTLATGLTDFQCLALRLQHVTVDNFTATEADVEGGDTPVVEPKYKFNFDTPIAVSTPSFKVASNWKHKVGSYSTYYSDYYMKYEYQPTYGVDGSGCLFAENQEAGSSSYSMYEIQDYLITPKVKGNVSLMYKTTSYSSANPGYIQVYEYDEETNQVGAKIKEMSSTSPASDFQVFTLTDTPLEDYKRLAIRIQRVRIDNFTADDAEITPEPGFSLISAEADRSNDPNPTSGTINYVQLPDGTVPITYKVKIRNTGEVDLTQGMEKYSLSLYNNKGVKVGESVPVEFDLARGEESEEFSVTFIMPQAQISDIFNTYATFVLQDDFNGEGKTFGQSMCVKYESKFLFQENGSTSSYNLTANQSYGVATDNVTKDYMIKNTGVAPLEIISITYPDGFSSTVTESTFTVDGLETKVIPITLNTDGDQNGTLTIVYKLYGAENNTTYELGFSGSKIAEGTWYNDFNGAPSTLAAPGSIAETNVTCTYQGTYNSTYTDNYIYSQYGSSSKFYTPLLHAETGDSFSFDIKKYSSSGDGLKVYVTKDRNELGEPVMNIAYADLPSSWEKKSITFDEEGDYVIVFNIYGVQLDNLAGLQKADVNNDIHFSSFSLSESILASEELKPSVTIYALSDLISDEYTVKFILNNEVAATAEAVDFDANPKTTKTFSATFVPDVAETATYEGFWRFEFEDGTIIDSPKKEVTIKYESIFAFGKSISPSKWYPPTSDNSETKPVIFDKTNQPGTSVVYKLCNSGGAPLNVTSISVSDNFSVSPSECVVPGLSTQEVTISFTAETAGEYDGLITIEYDGMEEPYTLAMHGTMLDPTKWYANFENEAVDADGAWPAGSVVQKNISLKDLGNYSKHNVALHTSSYLNESDRMFITPLLSATEGETMSFDARSGTTYTYDTPTVKVWAAKHRDALLTKNDEGGFDNAVLLLDLSRDSEDEATKLENEVFHTYSVVLPEAGNYYIGFELSYQGQVDEIIGLTPVAIDADLVLESSKIPEEGMQNILKTGSMTVRNFLSDIEAGAYTVKSYIGGVENMVEEGSVAIPAGHKLSDKAIELPVAFRSPKAGTFPVYLELSMGDFTIATEPVEVVFAEEVASNDKQVGTPKTSGYSATSTSVPFCFNYNTSEAVTLYSANALGLNEGDKIEKLTFRGYREAWTKGDAVPAITVYYEWTDDQTQSSPSVSTQYADLDQMTLCYEGELDPTAKGSSTEYADIFSINFDEPLVYEAGKSLRLLFRNTLLSAFQNVFHCESASDIRSSYYHREDGKTFEELSVSWTADDSPVLYIGLVNDPRTFSGTVTSGDDNSAVAGATVTMVSADGDNVTYAAETNENGEFNINVIQPGREYNVEVAKDGKEDFENNVSVKEESLEQDFVLLDVIQINDDGDHTNAPAEAVAYVQKALNAGFNAVALPIDLSQVETEAIFGEDAVIYEFDSVLSDPEETTVKFAEVLSKEMEAGVPYLVFIKGDEAREAVFKTKGTMADLKTESDLDVDFLATAKRTPVAEKMFVLSEDNFVSSAAMAKARTVTELPAYSGYIKAENASAITFTTDQNYQTIIEDAEIVNEGEDVIYDLNGFRVKNPEKGIYIINGKAVRVK